jgi:hypothetical protein
MKRLILPSLTGLALLGLCACGGGSSSSSPSTPGTLSYVNPSNASGHFALVLDSAATPSNLVLDLVGPSAATVGQVTPATGVSFGFDVDTTYAVWSTSTPFANGTVFTDLGDGTQLDQAWVSGKTLQGIVSYKGLSNPVADVGAGIIARITLTPSGAAPASPVTVSLTDLGLGALMDSQGPPALPIQFAVGTLTCK